MPNIRNLSLLMFSFILRLAAGMLVLVLMARIQGPDLFGRFAYWLAVATLVAVPVNFGLSTYLLREIGVQRERFHALMSAALTLKLIVVAVVMIGACMALPWLDPEADLLFIALLIAQLCDSFGEFFNLGFRRDNRFTDEAKTAVATSSLHLCLVGGVLLFHGSLAFATLAFCLSRAVGCWYIRQRSAAAVGIIRPAALAQVPTLFRGSWAYAGELLLFTAYAQADTLIVKAVLGPAGVGLYQAGMRLVEGACRLAPVFAQYVLPSLSAHAADPKRFMRRVLRVLGIFGAIGVLGGLTLALNADFIANVLYGKEFSALVPLLPWFGVLLVLRYLETAGGLIIVAKGLQSVKIWIVAAQLIYVLAVGPYALNHWGLIGWQINVIFSLCLVLCAYTVLLLSARQVERWRQTAIMFPTDTN